jgi:hypothetical protein
MDAKASPQLLDTAGVEELLDGDDRATVDVYVSEWKRTIRLRQLTAAEMLTISEAPKAEGMFLLISMSAIDPSSGVRLFKDADRLKSKAAAALNTLQIEGMKLNGMSVPGAAFIKNG